MNAVHLAISFIVASSLQAPADESKSISAALSRLRSTPDAERSVATKNLALRIRALPSASQIGLASSLANLATEGDFGAGTLQAVATTLESALLSATDARFIKPGYLTLAQLVRYEHVRVKSQPVAFKQAMTELIEIDKVRATADFTLVDIKGKTWTRSALKGKVVLVNFWATWCPPCKKEMPDLETLSKRFEDLVILAISDETIDKVQPFINSTGYTYPILLDPGRKVNDLYHVDGIPKSFIYDRTGKLVSQAIDMRTMGQFEKLLKSAGLAVK